MPIIKSAKKRVRQAEIRRKRNFATRRKVKDITKEINSLVKEKKTEDAAKKLPVAYKIIDTAAKKNIMHKKNAARKKSNLAKAVSVKK